MKNTRRVKLEEQKKKKKQSTLRHVLLRSCEIVWLLAKGNFMAKVPAVSGSESIINVYVSLSLSPSLFTTVYMSITCVILMCPTTRTTTTNNNMKLLKVGLHVALLLMDFICTCHAPTQPPAPSQKGVLCQAFDCFANLFFALELVWKITLAGSALISSDLCLFENNSIPFNHVQCILNKLINWIWIHLQIHIN